MPLKDPQLKHLWLTSMWETRFSVLWGRHKWRYESELWMGSHQRTQLTSIALSPVERGGRDQCQLQGLLSMPPPFIFQVKVYRFTLLPQGGLLCPSSLKQKRPLLFFALLANVCFFILWHWIQLVIILFNCLLSLRSRSFVIYFILSAWNIVSAQ